jgi:hypothetical protein
MSCRGYGDVTFLHAFADLTIADMVIGAVFMFASFIAVRSVYDVYFKGFASD